MASNYPRPGEHLGIVNRDFPGYHVALTSQLFDYVHGIAVDRAVLAKPRVVDEIGYVDDHRVSFPVADRIAVIRGIQSGVVVPAIGRDHAKRVLFRRIHRVIEEHNLARNFNYLCGRTYAGETLRSALKRGILVTLPPAQILSLLNVLRFVRRQIRTLQSMLQLSDFPRRLHRSFCGPLGVIGLPVFTQPSARPCIAPSGWLPET